MQQSPTTAYFGTQFLGFALFHVAGWFVALWIRKFYEAKRVSEQTIMFDSIWLLMTLFQCSGLTTEQGVLGWLGFLAFGGYKLVLFYGLRPLQRTAAGRNAKLLLLRVFGAQKRSEWLFDLLGADIHGLVRRGLSSQTRRVGMPLRGKFWLIRLGIDNNPSTVGARQRKFKPFRPYLNPLQTLMMRDTSKCVSAPRKRSGDPILT